MSDSVKPRAHALHGITYEIKTGVGNAFIIINNNGDDLPFEVFITIGKAGSDVGAFAEALGRMISLCLRTASDPKERALEIIDQLKWIGGGQSMVFGLNRIPSLPDAVAQALGEHFGLGQAPSIQSAVNLPRAQIGELCPQCGQATFIHEEGCQKCTSCGHSKC